MLDSAPVERMVGFCILIVSSGHHVVLLAFILGHVEPGFGLQLVLLPHQPLHGHFGVVDAASPPQQGFRRNGVRREAMHAEIPIASRTHGHLFQRIEGRGRLEFADEGQASFF